MQRAKGLNFLPRAIPFSEMEPFQVEQIGKEDEHSEFESMFLSLLYALRSDKERCVLFIEMLRQLGYNLDYESSAKSLHIEWRWFMRVKKKVRERLSTLAI